jgi:hypothetical protein
MTAADRNAALDPRLAGILYVQAGGAPVTEYFRMDLPSAGTYGMAMALGDDSGAHGPMSAAIYDNTTLLATVVNSLSTSGADTWFDMTGTLRGSAADWVTANPQGGNGAGLVNFTFTSGIVNVALTANSTSNFVTISHLWIQNVVLSSPPAPCHPGVFSMGAGCAGLIRAAGAMERNRVVTRRGLLRDLVRGEE